MTNISKLRSKNYDKVIEVRVPVRFYWVENEEYDGFEFGSLEGCTKYQLQLLDKIVDQLSYEHECCVVVEYMREFHKEEWQKILDKIDAEASSIPQEFLDAFKE